MSDSPTSGSILHTLSRSKCRVFVGAVSLVSLLVLVYAPFAHAAPGVPRIMNVQGRLMDSNGVLLGGSGTEYCFQFSFYDTPTAGSGTKLWPSGSPSPMTVSVRNGIYNAGIGNTNAGGDTLDFNFQDTDLAYLNVEVATKVGATCAPGDGAEVFETLSPRQRIFAAGYALNASMLSGFSAAQHASGNEVPVLSSGNLILGGTNPTLSATTTNILTLQGASTGDIRFFGASNYISATGNATFAGAVTSLGVSTTHATATNLTVSGGLTLGSLTGVVKAVAGTISAALLDLANDVTGILGIENGGTGTSTLPTYGQVLVGNAVGGYDLIATSSLGIVGGGVSFGYPFIGNATSTLLTFSGGVISSASSTIGNGNGGGGLTIAGNATTTGTLIVEGAGTSRFAGGIDIATGCFSIGGSCIDTGGGGGSGVLVNIQTFTTDDIYIPSAGAVTAQVIVTGGGGGGGGADAPAADTANETVGGGGGAGATSAAFIDLSATSSVKITVGAGGTAGANTGGTGGTGGTSRFSTFAVANGGVGGGGSAVNAACAAGSWGTAGTGGAASSGDVNVNGGDGHIGDCLAEVVFGGLGGASHWGGGGRGGQDQGANACSAGATPGVYGAGGGGGACEDSDTGAAGGGGGGGIVVVYEYGPYTGVMGVDDGGTGTTTAPSYGQLLIGNGSGGYTLAATSSLGITGIFSTTSADYYTQSSTTIAKTYTANVFSGLQTFTNASTTNISSIYSSSTHAYFGALSLGSLTGVLKATAGTVSASLLDLASETSGVLQVAHGGTGWANLTAGTLLTGNGTGAVATTTIGSSLQLSGDALSVNTGNANLWTALQSFANASSSVLSATRAYFGGSATTTVDPDGNVAVGGTLSVMGSALFSSATTSTLLVTSSTTLQDFTSRNATSSMLYVASAFSGAGLTTCSGTSDKLLWDSGTRQFTCGTDAGGTGSGISSLGISGSPQTGATQTFATSSDANIRIAISSAGNTHTFTPSWEGSLATTRGGTGWNSIEAGTLLTGNGAGAVSTTSVGSSLLIAANTLSLNLANENVWTGLQQFSRASSTVLETVTHFARTIQSTSTHALALRTNLSSTAGLTLGGTTTPQILAIDTANTRVTVGTGGASPVLFVLDTKNTAGDPSGVEGGEYFNSNTGEFRCYSGTAWRSCGGIAASSTGDVQFKNTDGSFTATSNFNWSLANNGLTVKGNPGQTTDLFTVSSSTGSQLFAISSNGVLEFASTSDPGATNGQLKIYAKDFAGRFMPKWVGPSGVDTPFQSSVGFSNISVISPGSGTTATTYVDTYGAPQFTASIGTGGTFTVVTPTSGSLLSQTRRFQLGSAAATANTGAYIKHGSAAGTNPHQVWRGNAAGLGGFFFVARFATGSLSATAFNFIGLYSTPTTAPTSADPTTNTTYGRIGVATNSNSGNWKLVHNSAGVAPTVVDLGSDFPVNTTGFYEIILHAKPNDSIVAYRAKNLVTGAEVSGTVSTNLPSSTTFLGAVAWTTNGGTAAANNLQLSRIYLETDY